MNFGIVAVVDDNIVHFVGFEEAIGQENLQGIERELLAEGIIFSNEEYVIRPATEDEIAFYQSVVDDIGYEEE